jgi:LysR family transcriptional activator of nhaA
MDWLNYHHLRYFQAVAREGGVRQAAERLHVSQPSISAQLKLLEESLGAPLFRRQGRVKVLTEAGQVALRYADEIFNLGNELVTALRQGPTARSLRLHVGVADAVPKLVTHIVLQAVFDLPQAIHVVVREGKVDELVAQLAAHRLDIVLADEPVSSVHQVRVYNHHLGDSGASFSASPSLARRLRRGFPDSLQGAPALLPAEGSSFRRSLEKWFHKEGLQPQVVADFDDGALMKVVAAAGKGFVALPSVVAEEAQARYGLQVFGEVPECQDSVYAITAERRLDHPAVTAITERAKTLFGRLTPDRPKRR